MKKWLVITALLVLAAAMTACATDSADTPLYTTRPGATTSNKNTTSATVASDPTTSSTAPTDPDDDPATTTTASDNPDPATTPQSTETTPPESTPPETEPPETNPPIATDSVTVSVEPEVVKEGQTHTGRAPLPAVTMTVKDPTNEAGLEETRIDYSFGVAKDGKPNQVSVNHQAYFDEHDRSALTLDNISTEKVLYLTFDNGYEYNDLTGDILDTLKEKNVPATFFCTLDYLEDNPDYVVRMINEGHIVGNHSTTHPVMAELTREKMAKEILGVENYLRVNYGYSTKYFRFPSGTYNDMALELVDSVGYRSVFWSSAHADWDTAAQPSVEKTFQTITGRLHPGSVILLHAVSQSNADALADIIDYARDQGYEFRSLDQYPGW